MLTSFIEAHEHAQKKIHEFIGLEENDEEEENEEQHPVGYITTSGREVLRTPEEVEVMKESEAVVCIQFHLYLCSTYS
jgi:tRNA(Glu) U13 pseudouridine synthase TruD